jgi:hypothetical protein
MAKAEAESAARVPKPVPPPSVPPLSAPDYRVPRPIASRSYCDKSDPRKSACSIAACSIFAAEAVFSQRCIGIFSASPGDAAAVIEARTAGDAVLRFAASAFAQIAGTHYPSDFTVKRLRDLRDCVGTGNANSRGDSSLDREIASPLAPPMGPRLGGMG